MVELKLDMWKYGSWYKSILHVAQYVKEIQCLIKCLFARRNWWNVGCVLFIFDYAMI